jgi:preprotein translocase subunit SecA
MFKTINKILLKIFGSQQERDIKKLYPVVNTTNYFEWLYYDLTRDELIKKINDFKIIIKNENENDDFFVSLKNELISKLKKIKNFTDTDIEKAVIFLKKQIIIQKEYIDQEYEDSKHYRVLSRCFKEKNINNILSGFKKRLENIHSKLNENFDETITDFQNNVTAYISELDSINTMDFLLPSVFSITREAASRALCMRHFDVQIMGGAVLHQGKIAEMKTGEGKTLVATLALILNSLNGKGAHLVTVNDYLAERDSVWMGQIYNFIGLTTGLIINNMMPSQRKPAYNSDITYGTNNEFGFDYLRDNIVISKNDMVQRDDFNFVIVDEVDSILIDEARTPLIISGPVEESTQKYYTANRLASRLNEGEIIQEGDEKIEKGDFIIEEKNKNVTLTEGGVRKSEKLLNLENLYAPGNMNIVHNITQAIRAQRLFKKDVDYIVKDGEVLIVDEFTGRLMPGRRFSDGLHQALEAKENIKIKQESQTLATITLQNYFRMYDKLSGMTGTADTEATEFKEIYKLDVVVMPTNKPLTRLDEDDAIYRTEQEKFDAVINLISECYKEERPILVGTISIQKSELLSKMLTQKGVKHNVLNAKRHLQEAEIISRAGELGAVTISTNMAGRGTDIVLADGVVERGGLYVLGTERHESRRIDNQLRGRSGRQGDPGNTKFFVSLDDDLMRIFGSERIGGFLQRLGLDKGQELQHPWLSKAIERAQQKVESYNFDIRKHLLEYDDVMNKQRTIIYSERKKALLQEDISQYIYDDILYLIEDIVYYYCDEKKSDEERSFEDFQKELFTIFNIHPPVAKDDFFDIPAEEMLENLNKFYLEIYKHKQNEKNINHFKQIEKFVLLQQVDEHWKEHLYNIDHLKEGIHLRGYASVEPIVAYKNESHKLFEDLIYKIKKSVVEILFRISFSETSELSGLRGQRQNLNIQHGELSAYDSQNKSSKQPKQKTQKAFSAAKIEKIGRNQPCPCGSGKKYKQCCLKK